MNSNPVDNPQNSNVNLAQLQNYQNWINTHLKKRPGVKLVENLQTDISNGVPLIHLIEVISGHIMPDVNLNPKTPADSKENIEKVLKFMQNNSVKMQRTTSKEILDGNLKPIMRLILALAAHFKPSNLQQNPPASQTGGFSQRQTASSYSTLPSNKMVSNKNFAQSANNICLQNIQPVSNQNVQQPNTTKASLNQTRTLDSMTHLVQAACVSIADVRRYKNENFNVKYVKRNNLPGQAMPPPPLPTQVLSPTRLNKTKIINSSSSGLSGQLTGSSSNINNQTYVTQNSLSCSPLKPDQYKPFIRTNFSNENSFCSSTMLSPSSSQTPLASSTILLANSQVEAVRKYEEKYPKNQTHIIEINNDPKTSMIDKETKSSLEIESMKYIEQTSESSTSASSATKSTTIQNNTITLTDIQSNNQANEINQLQQKELQIIEDSEMNLADVKNVKNILLNLQNLLMTGNFDEFLPDNENTNHKDNAAIKVDDQSEENKINIEEHNCSNNSSNEEFALSGLSQEEQIAILRSKIQQLEILCSDLRNELNQNNFESMHKVGVQSGLKFRLTEQDNTILEMKNEHLNLHMSNQQLIKEVENFRSQYQEQLNATNNLKRDLVMRDELIEKMRMELNTLSSLKDQNNKMLAHQQEKENVLTEILINTDRSKKDATFFVPKSLSSQCKEKTNKDEAETLAETIEQLRQNYKPNHPSLFLLDTLEKCIRSISERSNGICLKINTPDMQTATKCKTTTVGSASSSSSSINSSNSSSLTSSSANSPVLSVDNQLQSPSATSVSSSTNNFIHTNILHGTQRSTQNAFMSLDKQLVNSNIHLKRSTDSIMQQAQQSVRLNNKNMSLSLVNNEGHVKKIVSRFQQSKTSETTEDRFISPSEIVPLQKCSSHQVNSSASTLLTISSNQQSPTMNVPSVLTNASCTPVRSPPATTKCVYYLNKDATPYCMTIFKNVSNITLMDFKEKIKLNPSVNYRFFFKSQEPEFGYLKEEVTNDNKLLPCFENRIVAWIEESN